ncbi:hypothetical protein Haur_0662 [Herpetosiphon aurantiacus DSM 785]|uniref:Uncharacterized protein n=1 Tax=Herpetosiphon aurantiacus (strain ATCC 23779 / DSM 785 / 114-95) TaxID=316274 RepID=A9AWQ9_HERA2|nr:hypothetical protein Haur_0662 [Herpetosiphon aurantiacus DSM 785]
MTIAQQIAFEYFAMAREATAGTPASAPTHYVTAKGQVDPEIAHDEPEESRGTLAKIYRSAVVNRQSKWKASGGLDLDLIPFLLQMMHNGALTTPTTPAGATLGRLWEATRVMTSANTKFATLWFGDPNVQTFRAAFGGLNNLKLTSNVVGNAATKLDLDGFAQFMEAVTTPALPAQTAGDLVIPSDLECWIDQGSDAIGTTPATFRVIQVEHTFQPGLEPDKSASGPSGNRTWNRVNVGVSSPQTILTLYFDDLTDYDRWRNGVRCKVRVRHNGSFIETVAGNPSYRYLEVDGYGVLKAMTWGAQKNARTIKLTLDHAYEPTIGSDLRIACQNTKTTV